METIDLAVENGVTMLLFPPHCSHRLQPLNVSVYEPVKRSYNKLHNAWIRENAGKALDIAHIPMLMATLLRGATPENIVDSKPLESAHMILIFSLVLVKKMQASTIETEYNEEE